MHKAIPMHEVESSQLSFIGYDEDTNTLYVTFKNNATFKYIDVPEQVYKDFKEANSVGSYFNMYIKTKYTYSRM